MSTLEQIARAYAKAHPRRVDDVTGRVTTWNLWCASLLFRFTGSTRSYLNATFAGDAALPLLADPTTAPIGAVHYWGSRGNKGHVAIDVRGRGRLLFMASNKVTEDLGVDIGMISFADYDTTLRYRGWAMRYGTNPSMTSDDFGTFGKGTTTAGGGHSPITTGDDDMPIMRELIQGPDGTVWYSYERILRFAIPKPRNLATYQAHLRALGQSDAIVEKGAEDLNAYGSPVYADPLQLFSQRIAAASAVAVDAAISDEAILAELEGFTPGAVDVAALTAALAPSVAKEIGVLFPNKPMSPAETQKVAEAAIRGVLKGGVG